MDSGTIGIIAERLLIMGIYQSRGRNVSVLKGYFMDELPCGSQEYRDYIADVVKTLGAC